MIASNVISYEYDKYENISDFVFNDLTINTIYIFYMANLTVKALIFLDQKVEVYMLIFTLGFDISSLIIYVS